MQLGKNILLFSALSLTSLVVYSTDIEKSPSEVAGFAGVNTGDSMLDITGNYQCQGYDPYGKSNYNNPVAVTRNGETYSFQT